MSTEDVAKGLVGLCRQGQFMEAVNQYYSDDIVSVEPMGTPEMPAEMQGIEAIRGKNQWWAENHDVHGLEVNGPFVGKDNFAVQFTMDVTQKATGKRVQMSEVGVYTVKDGKIAREEFYYQTH